MPILKLVIQGRPITSKNSQQIVMNKKTGQRYVIQKKSYRTYSEDALFQIASQINNNKIPYFNDIPVHLTALYYMPNKKGWPDLMGLLQATCDILETAGAIDNDRNIVSLNGSKIVGLDKENARVEITLEEDDG